MLIWWPVNIYCTASQNGGIPQAYIELKLLLSLVYWCYTYSGVSIFSKKSKNGGAIRTDTKKRHYLWDPVWYSFPFYVRTVRSLTGTKVTHVGPATETKSEQSELIFRPIPCKRMQRNIWRPMRTQTGLSSSQSLVNTPQDGQPYR